MSVQKKSGNLLNAPCTTNLIMNNFYPLTNYLSTTNLVYQFKCPLVPLLKHLCPNYKNKKILTEKFSILNKDPPPKFLKFYVLTIAQTPSMIQRIVRICDVVDRFL